MKFNCKCSSGRRSCLHKCIAKWAVAQWNPQLLESVPITSINDDIAEEASSLEDESTLVPNEEDPETTEHFPTSTNGPFYPPVGESAIKMSEYIFNNKKIPPDLPLSITVEKDEYLKRLVVFSMFLCIHNNMLYVVVKLCRF